MRIDRLVQGAVFVLLAAGLLVFGARNSLDRRASRPPPMRYQPRILTSEADYARPNAGRERTVYRNDHAELLILSTAITAEPASTDVSSRCGNAWSSGPAFMNLGGT